MQNILGMINWQLRAFTLAEILIVLVIIGVITSIVIPPLANDYRKQTYVTQLKKFYTDFNQALQLMANDYGCHGDLTCTGIFDVDKGGYNQDSVYVMQILSNYLKTDKICGPDAPSEPMSPGCFGSSKLSYRLLNGSITDSSVFYELETYDREWATLSNGVFYGVLADNFHDVPSHCSVGICAYLYADVNGNKGPNQVGRDVFLFSISPNATLKPHNSFTGGATDNNNVCGSTGYGQSCFSKIMNDGWEMNY